LIEVKDGEVIREAGQYVMSMDHYHSQCCEGVSVSSSGLRKIYHESPADFWAFSDLNENRFEQDSKEAFIFGRAAHALLLGDEVFTDKFAVVPRSAPPKPTQAQILAREQGRISDSARERFDFWDVFEVENHGKDYLTENDLIHIEHISDALRDHPIVPVLMEGQVEQSLIWQDEATGIWLKSRLDILSSTGDLADLKSTAQKDLKLLYRDVRMRGYDMQLGLATMALEHVMGVPFEASAYEGRSAILLFVYKQPPYHVMPVEVDFDALYWARIKCRAAIDTMAKCIREGRWPGPLDGIATYTADFEAEQLGEKQAAGLLPRSA